jgi:hypothetical protein
MMFIGFESFSIDSDSQIFISWEQSTKEVLHENLIDPSGAGQFTGGGAGIALLYVCF